MELKNDISFKNLTVQEIYEIILPNLNYLKDSFAFLKIDDPDFKDLILNEIIKLKESCLEEYNTNLIFKKIEYKLEIVTKEMLADSNNCIKIVSNFIEKKCCNIKNCSEALKSVEDISQFLNKYNFEVNPDNMIELLTINKLFNKTLKLIFEEYYSIISESDLETVFEDKFLILALYTYKYLNNMDDQKESDTLVDDSIEASMDSIDLYLRDISRFPILTFEEEIELAKKIENGDEKAKKKLVESHLRCHF